MSNKYLYKTDVQDWKENHATIWRLKILLTPYQWGEVKQYFKYYKNRNLTGWGTVDPLTVSEILTNLCGDDDTKKLLSEINDDLKKIHSRQLDGYGQWHDWNWKAEEEDLYNESLLKSRKRELLGIV